MEKSKEKPRVYIGADHAGYKVKEELKKYLYKRNVSPIDAGPFGYRENDDYPDYAFKVAKEVAKSRGSRGILICGTGAGMAIAANKVKRIRAVEAYDENSAKLSREHNDANILTLGARNLNLEKIKKIVDVWLKTPFKQEERHDRRIRKILRYEQAQNHSP